MDNSYWLNKYNPSFIIPALTVDFLKKLPSNEELHYSIYLYSKKDLIQFNKPALFISFDNIIAKNTGYRYMGDLTLEFVNNNTRSNRSAEFNLESSLKNHLMLNVVSNSNFYYSMVTKAPFISFISTNNFRVKETKTGFKIMTPVGWLFQIYREWLEQVEYSPSGAKNLLTILEEVKIEVVI